MDHPAFVIGGVVGAERGGLARKAVRARKAGVNLLGQPPCDAPNVQRVKNIRGQTRHLPRPVAVEEAAQRHGDMTGVAVQRPPDEGRDVADQRVLRGGRRVRVVARRRGFLGPFADVGGEVDTVLRQAALGELVPVGPGAARLEVLEAHQPLPRRPGDGHGHPDVGIKRVRQRIHPLQHRVGQHRTLLRAIRTPQERTGRGEQRRVSPPGVGVREE